MDLVLRPSGGQNIVLRPQARAAWYPPAAVDAHEVEVFMQELDPETGALIGAPESLGFYPPEGRISIRHNPDSDKDVRLYVVPVGPDGTRGVSSLRNATQATLLLQRDTGAPTVSQFGEATAELITIAVDGTSRLARKRRVRIADNEDMTGAGSIVREFGIDQVPRLVEIARGALFAADFEWEGDDPASGARFTKTGAGTTAASVSPAGWRITTSAANAVTYYTRAGWPAGAFAGGFTLDLLPPSVIASDGAPLPNASVMLRVDDGAKRYDLRFTTTGVDLNGGSLHAHAGEKVRLVVAAGGLTADLWVGETKVTNDVAGAAVAVPGGLLFGDVDSSDDAEVVWKSLAYSFTAQDVLLGETIYVAVSHSSGGAFGSESAPLELSFASEGGAPGSTGDGGIVPIDRYEIVEAS